MQQLTLRQRLLVASMLFGMFFGAGNLIFPASMGQLAGRSIWQASAGFLITGVGLPLLGVAALMLLTVLSGSSAIAVSLLAVGAAIALGAAAGTAIRKRRKK